MTDELDKLIRQADSDIRQNTTHRSKKDKMRLPRVSIAFGIWLIAVLLVAFQFDTVVSFVSGPAESKIESDLGEILQSAAASLRQYELENGHLPPLLPNPSIRGLVKYERHHDFSFTLRATISDVTMVMESSRVHAYREQTDG